MKRIKVLHIITRLIIGGAQENTMYSVEGLIEKGWSTDLISGPTTGPEGEIVGKIRNRDIPLYIEDDLIRNLNPAKDIKAFFRLCRFIKKGGYGIVHTHSSKAGIIGRWAAFFAGTPVVVHTIHGLPFHRFQSIVSNMIYVLLEFITAFITDKLISVSQDNMEKCLRFGIGTKRKFIVIRSGLNIEDFLKASGKGMQVREEYSIKDNEIVFGTLARLFPLKGHEFILDIAKGILKKHPDVKFMFIGDGILREKYLKFIEEHGMTRNFIFTGLIQPELVAKYLDACDAIIHPSLREGLPRVVPQALLLNKPVIAFNVDGTWEVLKHGITGFLIPPENKKQLKKYINYVINNFEKAKSYANEGKKHILSDFPKEKMVNDIEKLYLELMC